MARIRTIKPDFWTDEKVVELGPWDRLLFIGLWNFCDDEGYFVCQPKKIKMQVFPGDSTEVSVGLWNLCEASRLALYDSGEQIIGHVINWERHQKVSNPTKSRLKRPDLRELTRDEIAAVLKVEEVQSSLETSIRKGREGKGTNTTTELPCPTSSNEIEPDPWLFTEFWKHYPRKVRKDAARKAFRAACKKHNPDEIVAAAATFARDPNLSPDETFIPHPASWLNQGGYNDGPLPPRTGGIRDRPTRSTTDDRVNATLARAAAYGQAQKQIGAS